MDTPSPHADSPVTPESVHTVYQSLTRQLLEAMRVVNDSRAPAREPNPCNTNWASVVKQLAKQAKLRSKLFYRRVKHSLLSPPAQSTLPVPTRKIQRILQAISRGQRTQRLSFVELRVCTTPPPTYTTRAPLPGQSSPEKIPRTRRSPPLPTLHFARLCLLCGPLMPRNVL